MIEHYNGEAPAKLIEDALKRVMVGISTNMDRLNRKASGNTQRKLKIVMESEYHGYLAGPKFPLLVLERGRGPNKTKFARKGTGSGTRGSLIDIIQQWIIDKGISVHISASSSGDPDALTKATRRMAGAIAYTIASKGTKLHRTKSFDDIFTTNIEKEAIELNKKLDWWAHVQFERIIQKKK